MSYIGIQEKLTTPPGGHVFDRSNLFYLFFCRGSPSEEKIFLKFLLLYRDKPRPLAAIF